MTASVAAVPAKAQERPVLIDGLGHWSLQRLGATGSKLPRAGGGASPVIRYLLPSGARQGPNRWYLMRLHFEVVLASDSGAGTIFVDGATNGRTAASVRLKVRTRARGKPRVRVDSLGLVDGSQRRVVTGRRIEARLRNYLQNRGVRPDSNSLVFGLERYGRVKIKSARVFVDSGIEVTKRSPAKLTLKPLLPRRPLLAGRSTKVGFLLRNVGDQPARDVGVSLHTPSKGIDISAPQQRRYRTVAGVRRGAFEVRARRPGRHQLTLSAGAVNTNSPSTTLRVVVPKATARGREKQDAGGTWFALGGLLVVGAGWAAWVIQRPRGPQRA